MLLSSAPTGLPVRCGIVSVVVLRGAGGDTRMLLARRAGGHLAGEWSYIAGHVRAGEAGWQAAQRELLEETGLVPAALYATGFCEQFYTARPEGVEIVPAFVARVDEHAAVRLNHEHSAWRWVGLDEAAARLPFGSQRDLLAHVRREFVERTPAEALRIALE
ncbi:MAG: NUDIX domain-containing protein [Xanthomonadaceae bacterium]|nr:NUDIX domain-containing protein [Xanthomonadaceae bacterium]MDE1964986.1 NUDIX domain-containing protein [Xanthomonadaceae bacterium]